MTTPSDPPGPEPQTEPRAEPHPNAGTDPADQATPKKKGSPAPLIIAIIAGVVGLGVYVWEEHLEDVIVPRNFGTVVDGSIYRSGRLTPQTLEKVVEQHGIKTVIDFGGYHAGSDVEAAIFATDERLGLERTQLPMIGDATGDPNHYARALRMMADPANHPMLVHCAAGSERTGACIALYRVIVEGATLEEAYAEAFSHKHDPGDNWKMPLYLGRWVEEVERAYHSGEPIADAPTLDTPSSITPPSDLGADPASADG